MSSYFEVWDGSNSIQITDSFPTYQVVRSGELYVDYNRGHWFGFMLNDNESFATFKVNSGNLIVSPMYIYNGKRVQYISSDGQPVKYRVFGDSRNISPSSHCTGVEIYNSSGQVVYSSNLDVMNYKMYKTITAYSSIFNRSGNDSSYMKAKSNMEESGRVWWDSFNYYGNDPYIMSYTIPWSVNFTSHDKHSYGRLEHGVQRLTGYQFSNSSSFSTHTSLFTNTNMNNLSGYGDLHQLGVIINTTPSDSYFGHTYNYAGVFCINYMFHIFDSN